MADGERVIYHIDANGFYASVEEVLYPELRRVPMAVCGDPENRRGIILAKNELAKGYGVKTAETVYQAREKCPDLVLRPARRRYYSEYCQRLNAVYAQYSDLLERASIDESYLDVTGTLHLFGGDAHQLAHDIRERVPRELGLTVSVGVSYNKVFAKMASDMKKPNAVTVVTPQNFREVIWPLPVDAMLMVGETTGTALQSMGIRTVRDLALASREILRQRLGKLGEQLHIYANGLDTSPVLSADEAPEIQSVGHSVTFRRNLVSRKDIRTALTALSDQVASRLRREGWKCMTVQVTVKDPNFKVITRQKGLEVATWLAAELSQCAVELLESSWQEGKPIRLLAVTALKLVPAHEAAEQLSLFSQSGDSATRKKMERLEQAMDSIRNKYGSGSITAGSIVHNDLGIGDGHGE